MKIFCVCVLAINLVGSVRGQAPDQTPVPKQPLLARAPDGSWTITCKYKPLPSSKNPADANSAPVKRTDLVASIRVEKKGNQYHVITTMTSGAHAERWYSRGVEIYKASNNDPFVRLAPDNPFYINFSKTDFDELSWIGMDNFKGLQDANGTKRFVFDVKNVDRRQTGQESVVTGDLGTAVENAGMVDGKGDKKQIVEKLLDAQFGDTVSHALVDVETQLPVDYDDGQVDRVYSYSLDPSFVPPDIVQVFQKMNEQAKKAAVPVPRP